MKSLLTTATLVLSTVASADEWIGPSPVEYIENTSGAIFFMRHGNGVGLYSSPAYSSCNRSTIMFQPSLTDVVVSRTLAIALSAQLSGLRGKDRPGELPLTRRVHDPARQHESPHAVIGLMEQGYASGRMGWRPISR